MRSIHDPNVPASLLKFWLRDLADPLIPTEMYDQSLKTQGNISTIMQQIVDRLPDVNRRVGIAYFDILLGRRFDEMDLYLIENAAGHAQSFRNFAAAAAERTDFYSWYYPR